MPVENPRRFNKVRKVIEDTVGISAFNLGKNDNIKRGFGAPLSVFTGTVDSAAQVIVPLYTREVITGQEAASFGKSILSILIDIGALGIVMGLARDVGPDVAIGVKAAYNAAASALPDVARSVATKIRHSRTT